MTPASLLNNPHAVEGTSEPPVQGTVRCEHCRVRVGFRALWRSLRWVLKDKNCLSM